MNNSVLRDIGRLGLGPQTVILIRRHIVAVVVGDIDRHVVVLGGGEEVLLSDVFNIVILLNLLGRLIRYSQLTAPVSFRLT